MGRKLHFSVALIGAGMGGLLAPSTAKAGSSFEFSFAYGSGSCDRGRPRHGGRYWGARVMRSTSYVEPLLVSTPYIVRAREPVVYVRHEGYRYRSDGHRRCGEFVRVSRRWRSAGVTVVPSFSTLDGCRDSWSRIDIPHRARTSYRLGWRHDDCQRSRVTRRVFAAPLPHVRRLDLLRPVRHHPHRGGRYDGSHRSRSGGWRGGRR